MRGAVGGANLLFAPAAETPGQTLPKTPGRTIAPHRGTRRKYSPSPCPPAATHSCSGTRKRKRRPPPTPSTRQRTRSSRTVRSGEDIRPLFSHPAEPRVDPRKDRHIGLQEQTGKILRQADNGGMPVIAPHVHPHLLNRRVRAFVDRGDESTIGRVVSGKMSELMGKDRAVG